VTCDACGADHVEEVFYVPTSPGSSPRGYIGCPTAGRVLVPLERLRCWELDFAALATVTAAAMGLRRQREEVVPSRLWLLGKLPGPPRAREVFLARGLPWADGPLVILATPRLQVTKGPLVLVPGVLPPAGRPRADGPQLVPLSAVLAWDGNRLTFDLGSVAPENEADPPLSGHQYEILEALQEMKAFTPDQLQTTEAIVRKAGGKGADPANYKVAGSGLRKRGLIGARRGAAGGYWLTHKGRDLIERIHRR
jgi:hypothetical protein